MVIRVFSDGVNFECCINRNHKCDMTKTVWMWDSKRGDRGDVVAVPHAVTSGRCGNPLN